jgi:hypothetical protein
MNEDKSDKKVLEQIRNLSEERKKILSLPPAEALERILDAPQPTALVQSFSEEDLYFLIQDIGPQDSLPLLSLASAEQWEYILDLESWEKDRINIESVHAWFDLLFRASAKRTLKWLLENKTGLLEFFLFKNIEVKIREHDQDPSDFGEDYFTHDNVFFIKFIGYHYEDENGNIDTDMTIKKRYNYFLSKIIENLAAFDHITYQKVMLEAAQIIPIEFEEEAYRLKNVRLAEKGFFPFDEAIGIYQPLQPQDLKNQGIKTFQTKSEPHLMVPVPQYSTRMLNEDNIFTRALTQITTEEGLQQLQTEFASLCNQVIAADQKPIKDRAELKKVVKKAGGYISIGLQRLTEQPETFSKDKVNISASLIQQYILVNIFRVGYGLALNLKWRADKWLAKCWFAKAGLPLTFWGEEWMGVLGGLLIKKPLFFDNYRTGKIYREFNSIDDIKETDTVLNDVIAFDNLLSMMNIKLKPLSSYGFLTFKNLVFTLWARHHLGLKDKTLKPLTRKQFKPFFKDLLPGEPDPEAREIHRIPEAMKNRFLKWLSEDTGLKDYEITEKLGQTFADLFQELESEYGQVAAEDLDPRYIHLFLLVK